MDIIEIKKLPTETEEQFLWKIGQMVDSGQIDSWASVNNIVNSELGIDEEKWRDESSFRKRYQAAKKFYDGCFSKMESDTYANEVDVMKRELEKERKKLQTEKIEYNRWLREDARDEMITEQICESIRSLDTFEPPMYIKPVSNNKSWLLAISDAHYGVEFNIKDFYGNIVNAYSPEIFEERMTVLFNNVLDKVQQLGIDELTIIELGDGVDGLLRTSQLMKLRYGVLESSIRYANYLATWLNELSKHVRIKFQMVFDSNHNQLRLLDGKKNTFPDENVSKVMIALIKERLKDNDNIVILDNPTGMTYSMMSTYCVVGFHGEKKNLKNNLLDTSRMYGIHIDYTISGHKHHNATKEIGFDSSTLSVGSIIGVDPYSISLNASSNASCSMFEFEQGKGRTAEYIFKLN